MKTGIRLFILFIISLTTITGCKDDLKKKTNKTINQRPVKKVAERVTLGNTGISLISNYKWSYNEMYSKLSDDEKAAYLTKEIFQSQVSAGYCLISCFLAKDGISISLKDALTGSLSGLSRRSNTKIVNRVDTILDKRYGCSAIFSKGEAISNTKGGQSMKYRVLTMLKKQKLYIIIGLFKPAEITLPRSFEETLATIQIN